MTGGVTINVHYQTLIKRQQNPKLVSVINAYKNNIVQINTKNTCQKIITLAVAKKKKNKNVP